MIITIDGPGASGKGTIARILARDLGFACLETGLLYRAVAAKLLEKFNQSEWDESFAISLAKNIGTNDLIRKDLRDTKVENLAAEISKNAEIRAAMLDFQREFAKNPPNNAQGAVLDGRDTGSVVCPKADIKFFITADLEIRAKRRWRELTEQKYKISNETVYETLKNRDKHDSSRRLSPLFKASDAHVIDTSSISIDEAVARALKIVQKFFPDKRFRSR
jgi:cytidylate kinase